MSHRYFALVPHPDSTRVFVHPTERGWSLPGLISETPLDPPFDPVCRYLNETWGIRTRPLRGLYGERDEDGSNEREILEVEPPERGDPGSLRGSWVGQDELASLDWADAEQRPVIERWMEAAESGSVPANRASWARPGWRAEAERWIEARLAEHGLTLADSTEIVKMWSISCLLKAPTSNGYVYFKASHAMFAHEARLTELLARHHPDSVPSLLAVDGEGNRFLMRDFGPSKLGDQRDPALWEGAMRRFAAIQVEWTSRTDDLIALGCRDRRLEELSELDEVLAYARALPLDPKEKLSDAEEEALCRRLADLPRLTDQLREFGLPYTLLHGDLHPYNIVAEGERIVYYDWSDGAVAHPFFDLLTMLRKGEGNDDPIRRRCLIDAYLEPWSEYGSMERLRQAVEAALRLAPLFHALSYHWIAVHTEGGALDELAGGITHFLKLFLEAQDSEECS
ncbi:MAG: aminoglycoside phosphotransferase family protein [Armatimonadetes bacterium]|nr:aminoglycoside phosphotransferase family protein [Armatimonadota bacterium]